MAIYIAILSLIAWQIVLPWILQPTERALTLRRTTNTEIMFFVSPAPGILNLITTRLAGSLPGYAKGPSVVGSYVIESVPQTETETRYHQRYYYLNLLNTRALVFIKQTPPSLKLP